MCKTKESETYKQKNFVKLHNFYIFLSVLVKTWKQTKQKNVIAKCSHFKIMCIALYYYQQIAMND